MNKMNWIKRISNVFRKQHHDEEAILKFNPYSSLGSECSTIPIKRLISCTDNEIQIHNAKSGECEWTYFRKNSEFRMIMLVKMNKKYEGKLFSVERLGDSSKDITIWDLERGKECGVIKNAFRNGLNSGYSIIELSKDRFAIGPWDYIASVSIWSFENLSVLHTFERLHTNSVSFLHQLPDGRLVSGSANEMKVLKIDNGYQILHSISREEITGWCYCMVSTPKYLYCAGNEKKSVNMWNIKDDKFEFCNSIQTGLTTYRALAIVNNQLIVGGEKGLFLFVYSLEGKFIKKFKPKMVSDSCRGISCLYNVPNSKHNVIVGYENSDIDLVNIDNECIVRHIKSNGKGGFITYFQVIPDYGTVEFYKKLRKISKNQSPNNPFNNIIIKVKSIEKA